MTIKLICLDADDTLWHNMRHFHATETALFDMLRPFAAADVTRERMIACEIRNLPLYGYGAKGFTLSMIETAMDLAGDKLSTGTIREILAAGRALMAHPVDLFDGVEETLERLAKIAPPVLVTKGDLLHQESKLAASGKQAGCIRPWRAVFRHRNCQRQESGHVPHALFALEYRPARSGNGGRFHAFRHIACAGSRGMGRLHPAGRRMGA